MALTPLWQGIPEILSCSTSTEYSEKSLAYYERIVPKGEGFADVIAARERGINPDNTLDFYTWKALQNWFKDTVDDCKTTGQITRYIREAFSKDQMGKDVIFDRTLLNHIINRFTFLGAIYKLKGEKNDIFYFELMIKRMGLDWFRIDNKFMRGSFQQEKGLFNIIGG